MVPAIAVKTIKRFEVEVAHLGSFPKPSSSGVVIIPPPIPNIPARIPPKKVRMIILL